MESAAQLASTLQVEVIIDLRYYLTVFVYFVALQVDVDATRATVGGNNLVK